MTVVSTPRTPPPRLPVRLRTGAGPALSPMLHRLAAERATGVLLRERGTLYLSDGQVVHAESPETPGLDVLLTTGGVLDAEGWREAVAQAGARRWVGRYLVDSGRVTEGALELCHTGAVFDAAYFVLGPSSAPARFQYGAAHWLGTVRPVPVAALERETVRRRELLHRIWPDPATDSAPLFRAGRHAEPPVPARQEAVLGKVDGVRTAADIARALGRPAFHTLVDLRRLAAAGIVTTTPALPRPHTPAPVLPESPAFPESPGLPAPPRVPASPALPAPPAFTASPALPAPPVPVLPVLPVLPVRPTAHPADEHGTPQEHPDRTEHASLASHARPVQHPPPAPTPDLAQHANTSPDAPPAPLDLTTAPDPLSALLAETSADPDVALLRRLRDALEAL